MKFRVVLKTKTKKGHDLTLKLKVPPSKVSGLVNFLNAAMVSEEDVTFTVEKISTGEERSHDESSVFGNFKLKKKTSKKTSRKKKSTKE